MKANSLSKLAVTSTPKTSGRNSFFFFKISYIISWFIFGHSDIEFFAGLCDILPIFDRIVNAFVLNRVLYVSLTTASAVKSRNFSGTS